MADRRGRGALDDSVEEVESFVGDSELEVSPRHSERSDAHSAGAHTRVPRCLQRCSPVGVRDIRERRRLADFYLGAPGDEESWEVRRCVCACSPLCAD
jgi:hypothetical protein